MTELSHEHALGTFGSVIGATDARTVASGEGMLRGQRVRVLREASQCSGQTPSISRCASVAVTAWTGVVAYFVD